ncbi:hypothetical protein Rumeso_00030 [Rubellimicrobium mesophilum DSM 19309]|uniref:BioF2-like acetyltransferase domain-containing protein n=1 Tax=Rubellimicrobium mesophilum DSM 19309 TaxID=442562 RepID=A0A017HW20_9RHOB|nr:hypothetical protein Rumeso_00030 [Rubellimicrobium mesophilum DSM 19309]
MTAVEVSVHDRIEEIGQATWDACACPEVADGGRPVDPFTTYRFLHALEESRSVGRGTGWQPRHLAVHVGGEVVAVAPLYAKSNSHGEYIFDWSWANAWERAGGSYYPKLQMAVPFTPVTGRRFLCKPGHEEPGQAALVQAAVQIASDNDLSSLHVTFCTEGEADAGEAMGLLRRASEQFHWEDEGYGDFEGFLAALSSRKRKTIRRERAEAQGFGGEIVALTGEALEPRHWDAMWRFYQNTGARKWGSPYLTRAFFDIAAREMNDDILLILAMRGRGRWPGP